MTRHDGRNCDILREVSINANFTDSPFASVLISFGNTKVWCAASVDEEQPRWMRSQPGNDNRGWITAEYNMTPASTSPRGRREGRGASVSGRTMEIQRLIGRSLRAVTLLHELGPRTITIDCEVLQADGGTRTASITGAFVALSITLYRLKAQKLIRIIPLKDSVAAVSCGILRSNLLLDLDYLEDSHADVDMNIVMTGNGQFVEIQGTAEDSTFDRTQLFDMIKLAEIGIQKLTQLQHEAVNLELHRLGLSSN